MANLGNSFTPGYSSMTSLGVVYKRLNPNPLDASTIFWSLADAAAYAKGDGSDERKLGATSYVGQIITVYEKGAVNVYKIEEDRSLASVGGTETIEVNYHEDLGGLTKLKVGQLIKVKFVKEGAKWYLRITIDKEEGVSIDDCVNMHHAIDGPLDEADLDEDIEDSDEDEVPEKCVLCPNYCWKCGSCTINI